MFNPIGRRNNDKDGKEIGVDIEYTWNTHIGNGVLKQIKKAT